MGSVLKVAFWVAIFFLDVVLQFNFSRIGWGVANTGVSFGLLSEIGVGVAVVFYLILVFCAILYRDRSWSMFGLLVGGLGNLIPRLWLGAVWDYLYIPWLPFWFNLSDVVIVLAVVSYILVDDVRDSNSF